MGGGTRQTVLLETVYRRQTLLQRLASTPARPATLADELDPTRSTIERGLSELESAHLIDCVDGQYRITMAGKLVLAEFDRLTDRLADVVTARPLLGSLPADTPIDSRVIDESTLVLADDQPSVANGTARVEPGPIEPQTALNRILTAGTSHRIYLPALEPSVVDSCLETIRTGTTVEVTLFDDAITKLLGQFQRSINDVIETERFTLFETATRVPYALVVTEFDDEPGVDELPFDCDGHTLATLAICENETIRGIVANDRTRAIEWATTKLTAIRANAQKLALADRS